MVPDSDVPSLLSSDSDYDSDASDTSCDSESGEACEQVHDDDLAEANYQSLMDRLLTQYRRDNDVDYDSDLPSLHSSGDSDSDLDEHVNAWPRS